MNRIWVPSIALLALLAGCSDDKGNTGSASSETTSSSGDGDGDSTSAEGATDSNTNGDGDGDTAGDGDGDTAGDGDGDPAGDGDGDGDTAGDGDGDGIGECGNGELEGLEECDDGPDNLETGACLPDCTLNVCGDGFVGPEEGCDDGNLDNEDGCSAACLLENTGEAILCGNKIYACGDTIDNDDDGLIDLADPECISPCDDDESTFKTNLPGQNNDCKADCYFDANSGAGDDKCQWNLKCDPENPGAEIGCEYDPDFAMCSMETAQDCLDFCTPLVPNGCDCFGCCEVDGDFVYLDGAECSLDNLDGCQSCTFFEDCNNPCEPELCELCFGQNPEDLPEECDEPTCPEGVTSCTDLEDCELGEFCLTGCCVPVTPQ